MSNVKEYFKDYPGKNQCFETSDGQLFHEKGDANLHAGSLKNDEVKTHKNVEDTNDEVGEKGDDTEPKKKVKSGK